MATLAPVVDPRLLVSQRTFDDAAVVQLRDDLAICFTADFITPVVDDPADWGAIAAANSLSDIFAMGGSPLCALNLVCWPKKVPESVLGQVLNGANHVLQEARCMLVGGHTVEDKEPKYGLAVVGTIHPHNIHRNTGARPGDQLYLTKPLGTGIISTAIKAGLASDAEIAAGTSSMKELNSRAAQAAASAGATAMTDVTGFGLFGHLAEMLGRGRSIGASISASALPILPGAREHGRSGFYPGGAMRNRDAFQSLVQIAAPLDKDIVMMGYDPQTSGGLLCAIPQENAALFLSAAAASGVLAARIGEFTASGIISITT